MTKLIPSLFTFVLLFSFVAQPARAELDGGTDSIQKDAKSIHATSTTTQSMANGAYTVTTLTAHSVTVREYVSPDGVIFGIAWSGAIRPNLSRLLGRHYDEYHDGANRQAARGSKTHNHRGSHKVNTQNLVLESSGRMRRMQGHAYLTAAIPAGVKIDDIK